MPPGAPLSLSPSLSLPTPSPLPPSLLLPPTHPSVRRPLTKLSRASLLALALDWLHPSHPQPSAPYLAGDSSSSEEEAGTHPPARTLSELRTTYQELGKRKGGKREVLDRILDGDWRHGLSLHQLAMASVRHLRDHPTAQRWTALELVRIGAREGGHGGGGYEAGAAGAEEGEYLPRFHAASFMQDLQREVGPVGKAHFYLTRGEEGGVAITLLRVWMWDSLYAGQGRGGSDAKFMGLEGGGETIFVIFPDCTASVYVSVTSSPGLTSGGDAKSLRKFILEAIPKALSRPQERYTLKTTSLSARSLSALLAVRGPGRGNAAAGGWSIFAEGTVEGSPLRSMSTSSEPPKDYEEEEDELGGPPTPQSKKRRGWPSQGSSQSSKRIKDLGEPAAKRRKLVAKRRFGETALEDDQKGVDRLEIRVEDPFPAESTDDSEEVDVATRAEVGPAVSRRGRRSTLSMLEESVDDDNGEANAPLTGWIPGIRLTFSGSHIFAGLRKLVESGAVDGEKMPGWMTGEASVSIGVVRGGRIRGNKGSGI